MTEKKTVTEAFNEVTQEVRALRKFCNSTVLSAIANSGVYTDNKIKELSKEINELKNEIQNNTQKLDKLLHTAEPLIKQEVVYDGKTLAELKKKYTWNELSIMSGLGVHCLRGRYRKYLKDLKMSETQFID